MLAALIALALAWAVLPRGTHAETVAPVLLNEALVSHEEMPDNTEYVELFGVPGTSLAGFSLVSVEGDSSTTPGTIDRRVDFPADSRLGANGFYLVGNPTGLDDHYNVVPDLAWGNDSLENGSQTLALVRTDELGAAGTLVTGTETTVDAVGLTDAGPTDRWFWSAPVIGPDDGFLPGAVRRWKDGVDTDTETDWVFADFQLGSTNTPTPATPYIAPTPEPTPVPTAVPTPEPTPDPTPVAVPPPGPSTAALWSMANQLKADGLAAGRWKLLTDRLDRVDRFMASGQDAAAAAQLQAFENQVTGLSPRWIGTADAQALLAEADALRLAVAP
jgi:hypothetical protein